MRVPRRPSFLPDSLPVISALFHSYLPLIVSCAGPQKCVIVVPIINRNWSGNPAGDYCTLDGFLLATE